MLVTGKIESETNMKKFSNLKRPNVRVIELGENVANVSKTTLIITQINGVATLEVDLDEDQTLVVLAEDGFEKSASSEDFLEHEIVRRRQIVEVVFRRRCLRCASDLVAHTGVISTTSC